MSFKLLSEINNTIEKGNVVDLPHTILEELDKEEKELVYKDNKTFENLFYLFFG